MGGRLPSSSSSDHPGRAHEPRTPACIPSLRRRPTGRSQASILPPLIFGDVQRSCGLSRFLASPGGMDDKRAIVRDEVAKWRSGEVAKWRSGEVAKWRSGEVAKWRSGEVQLTLHARTKNVLLGSGWEDVPGSMWGPQGAINDDRWLRLYDPNARQQMGFAACRGQ
jgi:hypothetical protein